jgi:hypothetical protein
MPKHPYPFETKENPDADGGPMKGFGDFPNPTDQRDKDGCGEQTQ